MGETGLGVWQPTRVEPSTTHHNFKNVFLTQGQILPKTYLTSVIIFLMVCCKPVYYQKPYDINPPCFVVGNVSLGGVYQ